MPSQTGYKRDSLDLREFHEQKNLFVQHFLETYLHMVPENRSFKINQPKTIKHKIIKIHTEMDNTFGELPIITIFPA